MTKNLKDKCLYYRSLTDYKLLPKTYAIVMLDGRSFSKKIKNKFNIPFSETFIKIMNETAAYVCSKVENCVFGYVQSDEISILIDCTKEDAEEFFGYRLCKMQSIIASIATSKFNQLMFLNDISGINERDAYNIIEEHTLYEFDCKAWNVPNPNDAYAWFLYRQNDCIRNSKQQSAQAYIPHKELSGLNTDRQIELLKSKKGISWEDYNNGEKYGRIIYKTFEKFKNENAEFFRSKWEIRNAFPFNDYRNAVMTIMLDRKVNIIIYANNMTSEVDMNELEEMFHYNTIILPVTDVPRIDCLNLRMIGDEWKEDLFKKIKLFRTILKPNGLYAK